ncbi:peptide/nickel transport system substrate-binding protein [Variovorax sp. HW608]|uniref:ABC transporter substrate-binding protein n=1 Tax=Variovorax sp. HW608 TaxID=1034889 RepID=UPI00081FDCC2|nr:ABC transporter substrate-binding protein [Variovorax sp. HW608]SCK19064.1 peptide/nickel transport system substrate-binding protein [Variovorax sp. HW608]
MKTLALSARLGAATALLLCAVSTVFAQADARPVLTISSGFADVTTMDPHRATAIGDKGVVSSLFDGLVRFPPGSADPKTLQPDLAEKWEVSSDNRVWTFRLRKGVQFHGGYGELKAADVVFSLRRAADPKRSSFAANFAIVDKIEALDEYTVRITLRYPDAAFLGRVSNYHGGNIVSKAAAEKLGDQFGQTPIGTGPFAFGEHVTQQVVKLVANDAYFRGKPKLAGISYRMIPADSARDLAFASNELDMAIGKREQRWVERTSKRGVKVDVFEPAEFRTLFLNRTIKPLDNLKVRQAIAAAINVDDIVRYAGKDVADKGCSVVPNGYLGGDCSTGAYVYDIARAKSLLAEAGYPNGITLKSVVSNAAAQQPIMEIVQAQLAKVGVKLEMEVVDHATYQAKSRQDVSAIVFYGAARFPNADYWLTEFYDSAAAIGAPGAMSNFAHCAVADDAIRKARIEPDAQKQLALWKRAQVQIHEDVCAIPLFGLKQVWARSDRVDYGYELKGALNLQPPITERTTVTRSAR